MSKLAVVPEMANLDINDETNRMKCQCKVDENMIRRIIDWNTKY